MVILGANLETRLNTKKNLLGIQKIISSVTLLKFFSEPPKPPAKSFQAFIFIPVLYTALISWVNWHRKPETS
ncbi:hypothetical protein CMT75_18550 [Elizabethkingia anophelis]|nr:hypothetical protein [Elizabethkingia anophelis]